MEGRMKKPIAIVAITKHGAENARRLAAQVPDADLYVSPKFKDDRVAIYYEEPLKDLIAKIFDGYITLVFYVSLGAVVRLIAPVLKDKKTDPAVLVVDDAGKYVISVLSGHLGGANEMAELLAAKIGAAPIVTTASDVGKTVPVDLVGRKLGWTIEDFSPVTAVSAAVVNEEPVAFVQETGEKNWWTRPTPVPPTVSLFDRIASIFENGRPPFSAVLLVTDRLSVRADLGRLADRTVVYRPRSLCLGMGCDSGVTVEDLEALVFPTLQSHGLSARCVRKVATVDLKQNEPGLVAFVNKHGYEFESFTRDLLNGLKDRVVTPSPYAEKYLKVVGVSEPAALLAAESSAPSESSPAGKAQLLVPKVKGTRCTLAVARVPF
ncbi:MAG: hypothetical protein A3G34_09600 [Candidatus Lindowbacteria bacterium RIFCSPLOWO2_12_FULL_62_27]|nr:MAG: hypothetical protein A3G34_09600 [Candidatus Lindowbacteria bacterium RIFCSPLOWO2_12_FULL_62_27]